MLQLDQWAVTRLNALIEKVLRRVRQLRVPVVTHAVNDFCVVDLSNFYLDIIKDRLYCDEDGRSGPPQRPDGPVPDPGHHHPIMAPILAFTCDEIWLAMPHAPTTTGATSCSTR